MSASNPALSIDRISVVGEEAEYSKMFDPPTETPLTPEVVAPTNPVPEVMAAVLAAPGTLGPVITPAHTRKPRLLNGFSLATWDGLNALNFFGVSDTEFAPGSLYPGPTFREPRGVVFHGQTTIGGPPHTIHWHGHEPTPMNDGVGHCSMEIGSYTYQLQPNFIGSYFYHCHRNTVQHFEFGLFGLHIIEPPDAFFASIDSINPATGQVTLNDIPVGACADGRRRTAANLSAFPQFEGFDAGHPVFGVVDGDQSPVLDPHAFTVPYDVECLWVPDDRDSVWSNLAPGRFATFPATGTNPGVDDIFNGNAGVNGFFAFNHYDPDYWFVTGVPVRAAKGGTADLGTNLLVPANVNSGIGARPVPGNAASQPSRIDVLARVGQTILVRCLDAAYQKIRVTFPVDVVIIAWDGRALGVPPFCRYNQAFLVPARTPIMSSVARRFDALIKPTVPMNDFATIDFIDGYRLDQRTMTARIPFVITP
jgi:hypothetical protein